jgi:hypothetical protein
MTDTSGTSSCKTSFPSFLRTEEGKTHISSHPVSLQSQQEFLADSGITSKGEEDIQEPTNGLSWRSDKKKDPNLLVSIRD